MLFVATSSSHPTPFSHAFVTSFTYDNKEPLL
jgi:hypothetical protein